MTANGFYAKISTSIAITIYVEEEAALMSEATKLLKLFYCYAREDKALRDELDRHLSSLKRQKNILSWSDRELLPGVDWEKEIDHQLNSADFILLLISSHFMASEYCYGTEMQRALERHAAGTARVLPILLRPVDWTEAPFSRLQMLPSDAKPVTRWEDRDEAFLDVANGIRLAVGELQNLLKSKEDWLKEGNTFRQLKRYEEALQAYEQAIQLDPTNSNVFEYKSAAFYGLRRYQEALEAAKHAILLDPTNSSAFGHKSAALNGLKHYQEALEAAEHAILLDPTNSFALRRKSAALNGLKRYQEALEAAEHAILLNRSNSDGFRRKSAALNGLKRYQDALEAAEHAIQLDPTNSGALAHMSTAFYNLKHYQEALETAERAVETEPTSSFAFGRKSAVLNGLKRYQDALEAAEHAIRLDPTYSFALKQKSYALNNLKG